MSFVSIACFATLSPSIVKEVIGDAVYSMWNPHANPRAKTSREVVCIFCSLLLLSNSASSQATIHRSLHSGFSVARCLRLNPSHNSTLINYSIKIVQHICMDCSCSFFSIFFECWWHQDASAAPHMVHSLRWQFEGVSSTRRCGAVEV